MKLLSPWCNPSGGRSAPCHIGPQQLSRAGELYGWPTLKGVGATRPSFGIYLKTEPYEPVQSGRSTSLDLPVAKTKSPTLASRQKRPKQVDISRAIKAAQAAGIAIREMIVSPGGEVRLLMRDATMSNADRDVAEELARHFGVRHA